MEQVLLVQTNLPDMQSANALAQALVQARLAACVNLLPAVQSVYHWQDKIEHATEICLQIKTTQSRYAQVERAIIAAHPYDLPEVIAIPVSGHSAYLHWVVQETSHDKPA